MRINVIPLLLAAVLPAVAQTPDSDVFVAPLRQYGDSLIVGKAVNVTHRAGYNNQPSFAPNSRALYYTARAQGQTDIWRYDLASRTVHQITKTPESEYSATVMPGGRRFSVIRVELDSSQRLWSFALDGTDPQLVLRDLTRIGYYLWLGSTIVSYVLGTPSTPSTLHMRVRGGDDVIIARDVGRVIQATHEYGIFTYTQRDEDGLWITGLNDKGNPVGPSVLAPRDNEFHVWTPSGMLLSATDGKLVRWNGLPGRRSGWLPVADLAANRVGNISRLAVSADGHWLAFVAESRTP